MEDVLDLYAAPFDPTQPVSCLDEYPLALSASTRPDLPPAPGRTHKQDDEYRRCGSCSLFGAFQPAAGWRTVAVYPRRTAQDFAHFLRDLVTLHYPQAAVVRIVLDNLNTQTLAALYETFPAEEARAIARTVEWHYTPVHGRWLNMIEIEWSVLAQQCLGRHLVDEAMVQAEVDAWAARRNRQRATVDWRFTITQAREVLAHLYPPLDPPEAPPASTVRTAA